jgi:hypothetical protein
MKFAVKVCQQGKIAAEEKEADSEAPPESG